MTVYYNEHDKYAAQWLRNLIQAGEIAPGYVDERSIEDVHPSDLRGFKQCHFFAGIGVWSHALRRAGWADDRSIWTGSCPCQPFSAAGEGVGFADERHLWPHFHWLIQELKPAIVLGEQVASKDADPWIDLVCADVEGLGYTFGAVPFPSASVGAPHIRDRLYWVAHANGSARGKGRAHLRGRLAGGHAQPWAGLGGSGVFDGLADADRGQCDGLAVIGGNERVGHDAGRTQECGELEPRGDVCGMADTAELGWIGRRASQASDGRDASRVESERLCDAGRPGPTNGLWRDADWLLCRDGKWRPVEPGSFPLVDGTAARMGRSRTDWHAPAGPKGFGHRAGRLKGYGNAINAEAARVFIETVMEVA